MTDQEINEAIANACGWAHVGEREHFKSAGLLGVPPTASGLLHSVPDYCSDLNAMHEAEKTLGPFHDGSTHLYQDNLLHVLAIREQVEMHEVNLWHATARQRAEAFLRTIGKWRDA